MMMNLEIESFTFPKLCSSVVSELLQTTGLGKSKFCVYRCAVHEFVSVATYLYPQFSLW